MKAISNLLLFLLAGFVMAQEGPLRHVVSFKFKPEATEAQVNALIHAFADLKNEIPQIQSFEWGTNNSPEGYNKELTHCFILTFRNEEDRDIYLPHPAHKAFGETYGPIIDDGFVIDFYAKEE